MQIRNSHIQATDGDLGKVTDCYFDEESWVLRYLVVDLGPRLGERKVLIRPTSVQRFDEAARILHLKLDRATAENSPSADLVRTVSRQYEVEYYRQHASPSLWAGPGAWDAAPSDTPAVESGRQGDGHLRSALEIHGYQVHATDRDIGRVEDLLVDLDLWRIQGFIVDTSHLPLGRRVILDPETIRDIDVKARKLVVAGTSQEVRQSPEYKG